MKIFYFLFSAGLIGLVEGSVLFSTFSIFSGLSSFAGAIYYFGLMVEILTSYFVVFSIGNALPKLPN